MERNKLEWNKQPAQMGQIWWRAKFNGKSFSISYTRTYDLNRWRVYQVREVGKRHKRRFFSVDDVKRYIKAGEYEYETG